MAPKKILFVTIPFKGHLVHSARLAEWFLQYPEEYEVHIGVAEECFVDLPEGVIMHAMDPVVSSKTMGAMMAKAGVESTDWIHSQAIMMQGADAVLLKAMLCGGIDITEKVKPDVVVSDHGVNLLNGLYTYCDKHKIPMVQIVSMGRPETIFHFKNFCRMFCRFCSSMRAAMNVIGPVQEEVAKKVGVAKLLPESQKPVTILPSSEALVQEQPGPEAIFTGPFLPLPGLVEESKKMMRRQSTFSMQIEGAPGLQEWLDKDPSLPIIYVALGTLVTPTPAMMKRIVEGLDNPAKWRVVWALPEAHRPGLPKQLADNFFLLTFAPQFALLKSGRISAFLSHCGANSTMESLCQGVPMLCMPFFGDQYEWQQATCFYSKAGLPIDKHQSTSSQIREAAEKILSTPMYRENAKYMAKQMLQGSLDQLKFLKEHWQEKEVKIEKMTKVGIPIAAGIIDAVMNGKDPRDRLPKRK